MAAPSGLVLRAGASSWRFVDTPLNETLYRCFCYGQATLTQPLALALALALPLALPLTPTALPLRLPRAG